MSTKLKITHEGKLNLVGNQIDCYVLEDETRVLSGRGMQSALKLLKESGKSSEQTTGSRMAGFIDTNWFNSLISNEEKLDIFTPIVCYKGNQKINGYRATALADFCDIMLNARQAKLLKTERQKIIADQCELLIRGFARVGITALVDEATGYQDVRVKDALEKILNEFLLKEAKPYIGMFPMEFYKQIYRLRAWVWTPESTHKRPGVISNYTNDVIYSRIAPGLLKELKKRNPTVKPGKRKHKHFQLLTNEKGDPALQSHFDGVLALQRASSNWSKFMSLLNRSYPKYEDQLHLALQHPDPED